MATHSGSPALPTTLSWMAKNTPEAYSHVRMMNGSNWLRSRIDAPTRARISPAPTLNIVCSTSTSGIISQNQFGSSPVMTTMSSSTPIEMASCCSSWIVYASGSEARGKCRARISDRLPEIDLAPAETVRWV